MVNSTDENTQNHIRNFQDLLNTIEGNLNDIPAEVMTIPAITQLQNCRTSMANTCCHNRMAVMHNCHNIYNDFLGSIPKDRENLSVLQAIAKATNKPTLYYIDENVVVDIQL